MKVQIKTGEQARKLVTLACNKKYADYDVDCSHGRYIIDMKSIMGTLVKTARISILRLSILR